jgi:PAS domain S-box-containing protein
MDSVQDRELFENVGGGLVVYDEDAERVVDVNERFCRLVGRTYEDVVGSELELRVQGGDRESTSSSLGRARREEGRLAAVVEGRDGQSVPVEVTVGTVTLGDESHLLLDVRDGTDRERELELYRRRLDGAMVTGDLAWWELDAETGAVSFHENKAHMLGYDPAEFDHYEDFTDLIHPDDYERSMQAMRDHYRGAADKYDVEYRIRCADGDYRWFHDVGGITERTPDGGPKKVTGVVVDVTKRKSVETELRKKTEQLTLLNRIVRHDIRNDMSVVTGWLDVVREEVPSDVAGRLDRAIEASQHTVELTYAARDLIEVIVADDERPDVEPVSLRSVLVGEVERVRGSYDQATVRIAGEVPPVSVEANAMLSSVFGNLLNNAVQHNDRDRPEVTVRVDENPDTVVVSVADDGPGISDERKEAVFGREEKGLDSTGSGLGLYLVETLVEAYGGRVWIEDRDPRGAVFRVELEKAA